MKKAYLMIIYFCYLTPVIGYTQNTIPEALFSDIEGALEPEISIDLSPPPLVEDPDRFYRSGEKENR